MLILICGVNLQCNFLKIANKLNFKFKNNNSVIAMNWENNSDRTIEESIISCCDKFSLVIYLCGYRFFYG